MRCVDDLKGRATGRAKSKAKGEAVSVARFTTLSCRYEWTIHIFFASFCICAAVSQPDCGPISTSMRVLSLQSC